MLERNILFSPPDIADEEIREVVDVLKSGWITTGPKTKLFEKNIAEYCNTSKAVCLNSATAAMEMTLRVLGVGPGDEVITTAYTYTASASVIKHVGAEIILVDSGEDSFHIDYAAIESVITDRTKAIIPVDIGGVMCDYERLFKIVENKKKIFQSNNNIQSLFGRIVILADAAHSFGAIYKNKKSGEVADFTCFSFHAVKNLTTAEGGAVTWNSIDSATDEYLYNQYMLLALHGQSKDALSKMKLGSWEYDIVAPNYKCNMTDIMAALGLGQLKRYDELLKKRKNIIQKYDELLLECDLKSMEHYSETNLSSGHLYLVRLLGKDEGFRNEVIVRMSHSGIPCNVHYKPLPMHTAYKKLGFDIKNYPNSFNTYMNQITLPLHTLLNDDDVEYISNEFINIIESM